MIKKILFVTMSIVLARLNSKAQANLNATWLRHTCGYTNGINLLGGDVWGNAVCADNYENSYNSGNFSGFWFTMDTVIEMSTNRFYINKYNSNGKRLWTAKAMGTTINSIMTSSRMKCDSLGNVYLCGTFSVDDSVYMPPYWYPVGGGYIAKYDSSGNNIWCRYVSRVGTAGVSFTDMSLANGYIYACGIANFGTFIFGLDTFNVSQTQNGLITKLDLNGNIIQSELLDPNSVNEVHGIEVSKITNDVYLVGEYITNLNVDAQNLNIINGSTNSFIIKMNSALTAVWAKKANTYLHINQTVGFGTKALKRIELDKFDNLYVTGNGNGDSTIIGALSFNHRISPNGSYAQDIYLVKLNSSGQELWMRNGGSDEMDFVNDIATDEWGNSILAVGSGFQSTSGLIFGTDTIQQWYGGLVKYNTNGNLLYAEQLQEARALAALEMGRDSVFYGTGNGFTTGMPYLNLSITQCEDTVNGYYNPPYRMIMVKFFDNTAVVSSNITTSEKEIQNLYAYPNPFQTTIYLEINLSETKNVSISILDVVGRAVKNIPTTSLQSGKNKIALDLFELNSGVYFCQLKTAENIQSIKLIKN